MYSTSEEESNAASSDDDDAFCYTYIFGDFDNIICEMDHIADGTCTSHLRCKGIH
jgi:hypothetical protein